MDRKSDININAEFYKKLNQQIVQKDALIKLLQKQIEKVSSRSETLADPHPQDGAFPDFEGTIREKDSRIEELEGELVHLRETATDEPGLKNRLGEMESLLASKNTEIERLRNDLLNGSFGAAADTFDPEERESLHRRVKELNDRVLELTAQAHDSVKLSIDNDELKKKVRELTSRFENSGTEAERAEAATQARELENTINLKDRVISEQNSRLESLKEKCGTLELNLNEYQESAERTIGELNSRIDELENRLSGEASSGMEAERLRTRVAQLEAELDDARLRAAVVSMDDERPSDEDLDGLRQAVDEWQTRFAELEEAKKDLESRLDDMMSLNENLALKISEQSATIEEIRGRAEAEAYGRLASEKNELLSQLRRNEEKLILAEEKLATANQRLSEETSRRAELEEMATSSEGSADGCCIQPDPSFFRELISFYERAVESEEIDKDRFCEDLFDLMARHGMSKIKTIGYHFDEKLHRIVDFVRATYYDEDIIAEEKSEGFVLRGTVLRKAEVTVVRNCLVCPACATLGRDGSNFCDRCGSKLAFPALGDGGVAPEETREIGKIAEIYTNIGISYEERGQFDKAVEQFHEALKIAPDNPDILGRVASAYELMGRYKDAIDIYEKLRRVKPESKKIATVIENLKVKVSLIEQLKTIRYEL